MSAPNTQPVSVKQAITMDASTLLAQVIDQRQRELRTVDMQLLQLRNQLTSEQAQWDSRQRQKELEFQKRVEAATQDLVTRRMAVEQLHRQAEESYKQQLAHEQTALQYAQSLAERESALANLNVERVEIARLRREADDMIQQGRALQQSAREAHLSAQAKLDESVRNVAHAEQQLAQYREDWNRLQEERAVVDRNKRQYEILKQEVEAKLSPPASADVREASHERTG